MTVCGWCGSVKGPVHLDTRHGCCGGFLHARARCWRMPATFRLAGRAICCWGMHVRVPRFWTLLAAWLSLGIMTALAQTEDDLLKLSQKTVQLFNAHRYSEALALQVSVAADIEKLETAKAGAPGPQTADALNSLSWYALFARVPAEALKASERARAIAPNSVVIDTNRAHALLFLDRIADAQTLYLGNKGKRLSPGADKVWQDAIAEDFELLRAAGNGHEAFPKILAELGINSPELGAQIEATRKMVDQLYGAEKYREASAAAEILVDLTRRRYGEERSEFADALNKLARSKGKLEPKGEAEALHRRSIAIYEKALGPNHSAVDLAFMGLAELYKVLGRYAEAEHLLQLSLAGFEKRSGPGSRDLGLPALAALYEAQGRFAEAEELYQRSIATRERRLGKESREVANTLNSLAELQRGQGRYHEAGMLHERALAIREKLHGPEHHDVAISLNNLAGAYQQQGRYTLAERLYLRSQAIREKLFGPAHPSVGLLLHNLGGLYRAQARISEAEDVLKRSLTIFEKAEGPGGKNVGAALNHLAGLYRAQGGYAEAETHYRRSLAIRERLFGAEHRDVAESLNNLGLLYADQRRYDEATLLLQQSQAIREKVLGRDHPEVAVSLMNLAATYRDQHRYADAIPLYERSRKILTGALGPEHPNLGKLLGNLGGLYEIAGLNDDAERLFEQARVIAENALGPDHPDVATPLNNLAGLYAKLGRAAEAEELYQTSLTIMMNALGSEHPRAGAVLGNLGALSIDKGDWGRAADFFERSTTIIRHRVERGLNCAIENSSKGEAQLRLDFVDLVRVSHRLDAAGRGPASTPTDMFVTAQWAQASEAAASLAQMAVRSAKSSPKLAELVRQRQDLVNEWEIKDRHLLEEKSNEPTKRHLEVERALSDRLTAIDVSLVEIDRILRQDFPDYLELARPMPLTATDVQSQLRENEALVLLLDTPERKTRRDGPIVLPEETFTWVVTKRHVRWLRSELGTGCPAA